MNGSTFHSLCIFIYGKRFKPKIAAQCPPNWTQCFDLIKNYLAQHKCSDGRNGQTDDGHTKIAPLLYGKQNPLPLQCM